MHYIMKSFLLGFTAALTGAMGVVSIPTAASSPPEDTSATSLYYVTSPLGGISYHHGEIASLDWKNGVDETIKIVVLTGTDSKSLQATNVILTTNGKSNTYKWPVPEDFPAGNYAFEIMYSTNGVSGEAYSNMFEILGDSALPDKKNNTRAGSPINGGSIFTMPDTSAPNISSFTP